MDAARKENGWLWFSVSTHSLLELDRGRYPRVLFDDELVVKPGWVCRGPNGGLHIDGRVDQIDIEVLNAPNDELDITSVAAYPIVVVRRAWADGLLSLTDEREYCVGAIVVTGRHLSDWITLRSRVRPALKLESPGAQYRTCEICGAISSFGTGKARLQGEDLDGSMFATSQGLFVRDDIARKARLTTPRGAHAPITVAAG